MKEAGEGRPSETAADKCGNNKDGRTRCDFNEVLYLVDFFFLIEEKKPQTCFFFFTPAVLEFTNLTLGDNVGK